MASTSDRSANSSIKGYIFQFDASLLKIIESSENSIMVIEGIEDFDIVCDDEINSHQCKYHESLKFSPKNIRDPIILMIKDFLQRMVEDTPLIKYFLYCHYSDKSPCMRKIKITEFKQILKKQKEFTDELGKNRRKEIDCQKELGITDEELIKFGDFFSIIFAASYEDQKELIFKGLQKEYRCERYEAEYYYYPTALSKIADIATQLNIDDRKICRKTFFSTIDKKRVIFPIWKYQELGQKKYCESIKKEFFSQMNLGSKYRFFIIEAFNNPESWIFIELIQLIASNWGGQYSKRCPIGERKIPIVFIRLEDPNTIIQTKEELFHNNIAIIDGYPFYGSSFKVNLIIEAIHFKNKLNICFLQNESDFFSCLSEIKTQKEVFEFFNKEPLQLQPECNYRQIFIDDILSIKKII